MSSWVGWSRPSYRLSVWKGDPAQCRGWLSPCPEPAVLVMPISDRDMLYCLDCWRPMAEHLTGQHFTFVVAEDASRLLAANGRHPDHVPGGGS